MSVGFILVAVVLDILARQLSPKDIRVPETRVVLQGIIMSLVLHDRIRRKIQDALHRIPVKKEKSSYLVP